MTEPHRVPVAVVGVSAIFPGSTDATGFWSDILAGKDLLTEVPPSHWLIDDYYDPDPSKPDKTYARKGGFLPKVDFDALSWGVPPSIIPATDTAQLLALIVAQRVLEDAWGSRFPDMDKSRMSCILGVTSAQELLNAMVSRLQRPVWVKSMRDAGLGEDEVQAIADRISSHYAPWQEATFPGLLGNVVAGRIANRLDLGGTNCVTDAACASTFSALHMAVNELYLGDSDVVIAGGVDTMNDIFMYMCFSKTPALSAKGDCRPFSDDADGTMLGEGLAMVALKRLADAERDGDKIYAVIQAVGSSSDGRSKSVYAPVSEGQAKAIRRAYERAGFGADTVELVEAHGTGTMAGDAAEFGGLRMVFDESGRQDRQWCALGSVKSQIGHTKAAAGAAGLFKAIMALHHKVLPPTAKITRPNPKLQIEASPFYLGTRARPWVRGAAHPRRAGVSSFGFGGSNFHVAMEEYTGPAAAGRLRTWKHELVVLSADSAQELASQASALAESCKDLAFTSWQSCTSWTGKEHRLAVVAASLDELKGRLRKGATLAAQGQARSTPDGIHYAHGAAAGEVAFLFPGQGSQYPDMGASLCMHLDAARAAWDLASELPLGDRPLHEVAFPKVAYDEQERAAQAEQLTRTEWAQPAIGAASLAALGVMDALGLTARHVAGHSYGEITALHAAGRLSAPDMLRVARRRGELMAEAASLDGTMTAVAAEADRVRALLAAWGLDDAEKGGVVVANHNHPTQVVLSGRVAAIAEVERRLEAEDIACKRLVVATAFHSPVVAGSTAPFAEFLAGVEIGATDAVAWSNASAAPFPEGAAEVRRALADQVAQPVRFVEMIEAMYQAGARTFVEVGPGNVLANLVGRILGDRPHLAVSVDRRGREGLHQLLEATGQLLVSGLPVRPEALWAGFKAPVDPTSVPKPKLAVPIDGTNVGKPYPPKEGAAGRPQPNPPRAAAVVEKVVERVVEKPVVVEKIVEKRVEVPVAAPYAAPPSPAPGSTMSAPPSSPAPTWLSTFQEVQRQTAEAHASYQQAMARSHEAFLKAAETSIMGLATLGQGLPAPVAAPAPAWTAPVAAPTPALAAPAPVVVAPAPAPVVVAPAPVVVAPAPVVVAPAPAAPAPAAGPDLTAVMMAVVADKTGYPAEMLSLSMDMEGDLGIDSIKRVEILSAMKERVPGLPEVDPGELAKLRTLGEVVAHMGGGRATSAAPVAPAPAPWRGPQPGRYLTEVVAAPAMGMVRAGLPAGAEVLVTGAPEALAQALARALADRGLPARAVAEVPVGAEPGGLVILGGLDDQQSPSQAHAAAFAAAHAVAARLATHGGLLVTVQDTGGRFGLGGMAPERAWRGGLAGLARTAAQEWPKAAVKAVDLERGARADQALAQALADEIVAGGPELEVGLCADGQRVSLVDRAVPAAPGAQPLGPQDVILVSGGARGVTAATVVALARDSRARFVLLGRSRLQEEPACCAGQSTDAELKRALLADAKARGEAVAPAALGRQVAAVLAGREIRQTVAAIQAAGGQARYDAVDVTDAGSLRALLHQVRSTWGPITGVIHGAGVLADKLIADKSAEQFRQVFETKVEGLAALLEATGADPLAVILLFSSVAARCGNQGQVDYAMANEVLNQVARAEAARRPGCVVKALGWGPWEGGMVTPALKARFEKLGVPVIPLDDGARMLVEEVRSPQRDQVALVLGGAPRVGQPLAAEGRQDLALDLVVNRARQPYLADHSIQGTPVVPVVLVVEWFARAARAFRPDLKLNGIDEIKVLSGVKLAHFDNGGDHLRVGVRQVAEEPGVALAMELTGPNGRRHYTAVARMGTSLTAGAAAPTLALPGWGSRPVYGDVLFHGEQFQVISDMQGLSAEGGVATLRGVREAGWQEEPWLTDVAAMDGGLQLALLWTQEVLGGHSLPTGVGAVKLASDAPSDGPLRCVLTGRGTSGGRTLSDVVLVDQAGRTVAELQAVETHLLPPTKAASPAPQA